MIYLYYASTYFIKIQLNVNEQKKKSQRIYDLLNVETETKFPCLLYTQLRKIFYRKRRSERLKKKIKRRLFNCSCYGD